MALHDRLMDDARGSLPGATDAAILRELWNVIDEACRDGWIWRESKGVTLEVGRVTYFLTPTGADVVQVLSVSHDTLDLTNMIVEFGTLYLTTPPVLSDIDVPLVAVLVLAPSLEAGADPEGLIPGDMWRTFHQMWLHGLLARMMAQPAKPYSNTPMAVFHRRSFTRDVAQARLQVRTENIPGAQAWRFPAWA